jgi:NIPSNAP protein
LPFGLPKLLLKQGPFATNLLSREHIESFYYIYFRTGFLNLKNMTVHHIISSRFRSFSRLFQALSLFSVLSLLVCPPSAAGFPASCITVKPVKNLSARQEFYHIRVYLLKTAEQEARVDSFLQNAYLPALHRLGIRRIGVFKPISNDTAMIRRIFVLIPFHSLEQFAGLPGLLEKDPQFLLDGKSYLDASHTDPPYVRIESTLLKAFPGMPVLEAPASLKAAPSEKIYELRSYEGPTEHLFDNKVRMFNEGGEISLFKRLRFNAVFYASVLSGSHMPNLMYMTSFESMASREQHWKTFGEDPFWKKLLASPEYQHNVSHVDIVFLHPAIYSDL